MSPNAAQNAGQTFDYSKSEVKRSKPNRVIIQARDLSNALMTEGRIIQAKEQNEMKSAELPQTQKYNNPSLINLSNNNLIQPTSKSLHQTQTPVVIKSKIQNLNISQMKTQNQNSLVGNQRDLSQGFQGKPGLQNINQNRQIVVMKQPISNLQANNIFINGQTNANRKDDLRPYTGLENAGAIHDYYVAADLQSENKQAQNHYVKFNPIAFKEIKSSTINPLQNQKKQPNTNVHPSSLEQHKNAFSAQRAPATMIKQSSSKINALQSTQAQSFSQSQLTVAQVSPSLQMPKNQILSKGLKLMKQMPQQNSDHTERPQQLIYSQMHGSQQGVDENLTILSEKIQNKHELDNGSYRGHIQNVSGGISASRKLVPTSQPQYDTDGQFIQSGQYSYTTQHSHGFPTFQNKHNSVGQSNVMNPTQHTRNSPQIQTSAPGPNTEQDEQIFQKNGHQIAGFKINPPGNFHQPLQVPHSAQKTLSSKANNLSVFEMNFLKGQGVNLNLVNQQSNHSQNQQSQSNYPSNQQYQWSGLKQGSSQKVSKKGDMIQSQYNVPQQMILAEDYCHQDSIAHPQENMFSGTKIYGVNHSQSPYKLSSKSNISMINTKLPGNNYIRLKHAQQQASNQTSQNRNQLISGNGMNLPFNKVQQTIEQYSNVPSPQKPRMKSTNLSDQLSINAPPSNLIYQHKSQQKQNSLQPGASHQQSSQLQNIQQDQQQIGQSQIPPTSIHQPTQQQLHSQLISTYSKSESPLKQLNEQHSDQVQLAIQNISSEQDKIIRQIIAQNRGQLDAQNLQIILEQINRAAQNQSNGQYQKSILPTVAPVLGQFQGQQQQSPLLQMMYSQGNQVTYQLNTSQVRRNIGPAQKGKITDLYGKEKQKSKIPFENAYVEDCYKFIVTSGNNSGLIRKALEKRSWWIEIPPVHSMFNFKWQPTSTGIRFERLSAMKQKPGESYGMGSNMTSFNTTMGGGPQDKQADGNNGAPTISDLNQRQCVNHLEYHHLLSEKFNLLNVLTKYCDTHKENVFDITPVTFYVEMPNVQKDSAYNSALLPFMQYYQALEDNKKVISEVKEQLEQLKEKELERALNNNEPDNEDGQQDQDMDDMPPEEPPIKENDDMENENLDMNQNEDNNSDSGMPKDEKKKESKNLLSNQGGLQTLYKTPIKDTNNMKSTKFKSFNFEKRTFTRYTCPLSHFDGHNLWLLKPTHLNRGRGIHVFQDLPTLHKLIKEYCLGKDEESWKKKQKQFQAPDEGGSPGKELENDIKIQNQIEELEQLDTSDMAQEQLYEHYQKLQSLTQSLIKSSPTKTSSKSGAFKIKHNDFIIQKYIERPQTICKRKFDFRVWVLLDQDQNIYIFKEGYIRMSGSEYGIDPENVDNAAVHLTNNAVQKQLDSYGKFEDGNILSYKRYQELLNQEQPDCGIDIYEHIVPMMKVQVLKTFYSVRKSIDPQKRKYTFELFGYDFILDEDFNTWLIEVNTNPCLEESNGLLRDMIPRAIEDMFKLTIDKIFPKHSLKRKRNPGNFEASTNSPVKTKSKKAGITTKVTKNKNLAKIDETPEAQEDPEDEASSPLQKEAAEQPPMDPEMLELDKQRKALKRIHPVDGYSDSENMWEKLINIEKCQHCPPTHPRDSNNKNRYTIAVQDRVFKIKKNPFYIQKKKENEKSQINLIENTNENMVAEAQNLVTEKLQNNDSMQEFQGS